MFKLYKKITDQFKNNYVRMKKKYVRYKKNIHLTTVNSRYKRRNGPQIYVCYIVKYVISSDFFMVKYVIDFE